jgi:osmotically inducible protein OsmC
MTSIYQTEATAIGGRTGSAASFDGVFRVRLAAPAALGGASGEGSNPEQLFAAGYAACFLSAIKDAAAREGTAIAEDANVTATVGLGTRDDETGLHLHIALGIDLPGLDGGTAERLVAAAHRASPYSNAMRGNIDVELKIA